MPKCHCGLARLGVAIGPYIKMPSHASSVPTFVELLVSPLVHDNVLMKCTMGALSEIVSPHGNLKICRTRSCINSAVMKILLQLLQTASKEKCCSELLETVIFLVIAPKLL